MSSRGFICKKVIVLTDIVAERVISSAHLAVAGNTTPMAARLIAALPPRPDKLAQPVHSGDNPAFFATYHRGARYHTSWCGPLPSLIHQLDLTDTEREKLSLTARKFEAENTLVLVIGESTSLDPSVSRASITPIGLIVLIPEITS